MKSYLTISLLILIMATGAVLAIDDSVQKKHPRHTDRSNTTTVSVPKSGAIVVPPDDSIPKNFNMPYPQSQMPQPPSYMYRIIH